MTQYSCSRKSDDNTVTIRRTTDEEEIIELDDTHSVLSDLDKLADEMGIDFDAMATNSGIGEALMRAADILNMVNVSSPKPLKISEAPQNGIAVENAELVKKDIVEGNAGSSENGIIDKNWTLPANSTVIATDENSMLNTVYMTDRSVNLFIKAGKIRIHRGSLYYVD